MERRLSEYLFIWQCPGASPFFGGCWDGAPSTAAVVETMDVMNEFTEARRKMRDVTTVDGVCL